MMVTENREQRRFWFSCPAFLSISDHNGKCRSQLLVCGVARCVLTLDSPDPVCPLFMLCVCCYERICGCLSFPAFFSGVLFPVPHGTLVHSRFSSRCSFFFPFQDPTYQYPMLSAHMFATNPAASAAPAPMALFRARTGVLIGSRAYHAVQPLGSGTYASVFQALTVAENHPVAVKVLDMEGRGLFYNPLDTVCHLVS